MKLRDGPGAVCAGIGDLVNGLHAWVTTSLGCAHRAVTMSVLPSRPGGVGLCCITSDRITKLGVCADVGVHKNFLMIIRVDQQEMNIQCVRVG